MSSEIKIVKGVAQLVELMLEGVKKGSIELSAKGWAQLDRRLQEAHKPAQKEGINQANVHQIAWLVIGAFKENKTLKKHFRKKLRSLTKGTKRTSRDQSERTSAADILWFENSMTDLFDLIPQMVESPNPPPPPPPEPDSRQDRSKQRTNQRRRSKYRE